MMVLLVIISILMRGVIIIIFDRKLAHKLFTFVYSKMVSFINFFFRIKTAFEPIKILLTKPVINIINTIKCLFFPETFFSTIELHFCKRDKYQRADIVIIIKITIKNVAHKQEL